MENEFTVELPKLGESIVSATVVKWFKDVGDAVKLDEPLLEVSTDKVNSEIPSPVSGVITKILAQPDEELDVGQPLCSIRTTSVSMQNTSNSQKELVTCSSSSSSMKKYYSPVVLKIAQQENISLDFLEKIPATGLGGRVTKKDLEEYLEKRVNHESDSSRDIKHVKLSGMRKSIADNMVKSFYEAPHATLINEVDVTNIKKYIDLEKEAFLQKFGAKLSITTFLAKAIASAVQEFPFINASLEHDTIVLKRFVHLGIAVSVDQGVMVPVIKSCHQKSIAQIAQDIGRLSEKARSNRLSYEDIQNGTITLTNFGMSGTLIGVPIIRYPEVAIIGAGAIHKKVAVQDDDSIAIRHFMHLSLTFDHRVLDGMYGCDFLNAVKKHLLMITNHE